MASTLKPSANPGPSRHCPGHSEVLSTDLLNSDDAAVDSGAKHQVPSLRPPVSEGGPVVAKEPTFGLRRFDVFPPADRNTGKVLVLRVVNAVGSQACKRLQRLLVRYEKLRGRRANVDAQHRPDFGERHASIMMVGGGASHPGSEDGSNGRRGH